MRYHIVTPDHPTYAWTLQGVLQIAKGNRFFMEWHRLVAGVHLVLEGRVVAIATVAGAVVGWTAWRPVNVVRPLGGLWIEQGIWVHSLWRRRGIAKALWRRLAQHCRPESLRATAVTNHGYTLCKAMAKELPFLKVHAATNSPARDLRAKKRAA